MKSIKVIYYVPFIVSVILITIISILIMQPIISIEILLLLVLFLISGFILSKGYLIGNLIGIIPAIICTCLGTQENGQWINEIVIAIPIYIFYIITFFIMIVKKTKSSK